MEILITGGAGYIGSVVGEHLQTLGYSLVVIDDLRDGKIKAVPTGATFYEANFSDTNVLDTISSVSIKGKYRALNGILYFIQFWYLHLR